MTSRAYPLQWTDGWSRTPTFKRRRGRYKVTPAKAKNDLMHSLTLLGAMRGSIIVSSNIPVKNDGMPYATFRTPEDVGVAVYWTTRSHGERVMARYREYASIMHPDKTGNSDSMVELNRAREDAERHFK